MYVKTLSPQQTSELVTFYANTFQGKLSFDEFLMLPSLASRFVSDFIRQAKIWETPEWVVMRALRDALHDRQ